MTDSNATDRTWYYLCDICACWHEVHIDGIGTGDYECEKYGFVKKKAICGEMYPHEVCDCFKAKEGDDGR